MNKHMINSTTESLSLRENKSRDTTYMKQVALKFLMLTFLFAGLIPLSQVSYAQSTGAALYEESVVDMEIAYMGGVLQLERVWANGRWTFNPNWADLQFFRTADSISARDIANRNGYRISDLVELGVSKNVGFGVPGDISGRADAKDIKGIRRNLSLYEPIGGAGQTYKYLSTKTIVRTLDGYRWLTRSGRWIDYDLDGKILRFGNRNNQTISFLRDADDNIEHIVDQFGFTLATYQYSPEGRPLSLTDYSGRSVGYYWSEETPNNLSVVTDVRGNDWQYTYRDFSYARVMESKIDPEGRAVTIEHTLFNPDQRCGGGNTMPLMGYNVINDDGYFEFFAIDRRLPLGEEETPVFDEGTSVLGVGCRISNPGDAAVVYSRLIDEIGVALENEYYFSDSDDLYYYSTTRAGQGREVRKVNLQGETIEVLINGELQKEIDTSEDRRRVVETDRNGYVTTYNYDEFENITHVQFADGTEESWKYNQYSQVTEYTNPRNIVSTINYDDRGNIVQITEAKDTPEERVSEFEYDNEGRMTLMRLVGDDNTQESLTQWTEYDNFGNPLTQVSPLGVETHYTYDVIGNVLTYTDGKDSLWQWTLDQAGYITAYTDPLLHVTTFIYDKVGRLKEVINALEKTVATYTYNARNSLLTSTNAYNQTRTNTYNEFNQLITRLDENGNATSMTYDAFGRPETNTDMAGNVIRFVYDGDGASLTQPSAIILPTYTERMVYDRRYRIKSSIQQLNDTESEVTQFVYDEVGNVTLITDAESNQWTREYDALNRARKIIDPEMGEINYRYDDRNNMLSVTNELNVVQRQFAFNVRNQITTEQLPSGETYTYAYDVNGNLDYVVDPKGQLQKHLYDTADRSIGVELYSSAAGYLVEPPTIPAVPEKIISYNYNNANSLTYFNDGVFSGTYGYDDMQRLIAETVDYGAFTKSHAYTYTPTGKKASLTHPDGTVNEYHYDNVDRLNRIVIPGQGTITVNEFNWTQPSTITFPGGTVQENTFDPLGRLNTSLVRDPANNVLMQYGYEFDNTGNVTKKATEKGDYEYEYDDLGQLTSAKSPTLADENYTYDAAGNRLGSGDGEEQWQYDESNALESFGDNAYTYDKNGSAITRTINGETQNFIYNIENRLSEVRDAQDNMLAQYIYDPFGHRIAKIANNQTTYYHYTQEGMVAEYDGNGEEIQAYSYHPYQAWNTSPIYTQENGNFHYYINDYIGTPQKLFNSSGAVTWSAEFSAFGQAHIDPASTVRNPLRFAGQFYDEITGLHQNMHRDYDPMSGRYLQSDPIGIAGGLNTYMYAGNNPSTYSDPTGEFIIPVGTAAAAAYARCVTQCTAVGAVAAGAGAAVDYLGGEDCNVDMGAVVGAMGQTAASCAKECLNPFNWFGGGAKKKAPKNQKKPCNCFVEGTEVLTDEGPVSIEEIEIGDRVASRDEKTGEFEYKEVVNLFQFENREVFDLRFAEENGDIEEFRVTAEHPFYIEGRGWVEVRDLNSGDVAHDIDGDVLVVLDVLPVEKLYETYNFEVADFHTYFVGEDGVWVHNDCDEEEETLIRFGTEEETLESLAEQAAAAEENGFPHGVSTKRKKTKKLKSSDKKHKTAKRSDAEGEFEVTQTGGNKDHHTVHLPKPVTQEVVDKFNKTFPPKK